MVVPLSVALAAFAGIVTARTSYGGAVRWFSLALVGQAATLQLIDAGHLLRYQHYRPLATLASEQPEFLAFLAVQAILVVLALLRWGGRAWSRMAPLSRPRLAVALLLSVATAATVSPSPLRYVSELSFAASLQVLALATVLLGALALPESCVDWAERTTTRLFGPRHDRDVLHGRDGFGWVAGAAATFLAATLAVLSYQRHPHVPDEVVYFLHARYFAAGLTSMPLPPVVPAFELDLMSYEATRWFSPVPPGWPAVLAVGAYFAVPWLVNPVLTGISVLLAYALLKTLYSRRTARYATALLAASPWFLFLGMSFMTHMLTLTCALLAAVGVARARQTGRFAWGLLGGVGVGATSLIRPLDGLLVGILIALWAIGFGGSRLRLAALAGLFLGTVATGAMQFPYNEMMTGDPRQFPINAYTDAHYGKNSNAYGFGPDRGLGWAIDPNPGHSPLDGVINANLNTFGINTDLFGWSTGSLILIAVLLGTGRLSRSDLAMLAVGLVIVTGYFFYYFSGGPDFGARYWFPIIVPLVALSARGLHALEHTMGARAVVAVAALVMMSASTYIPWRAVDKYRHFRGMRPDLRMLAAKHHFDGDLVLVRGRRHPDYASAAVLNPVDLRSSETVFAWDRDSAVRAQILGAYPGRRVWIVAGPSVTGDGYRIIRGPVSPAELENR
jgi:4-amino-4-deoxy-L-arabinose transferase-like glycosyltransferase